MNCATEQTTDRSPSITGDSCGRHGSSRVSDTAGHPRHGFSSTPIGENPSRVSTTHAKAREEALRRALSASSKQELPELSQDIYNKHNALPREKHHVLPGPSRPSPSETSTSSAQPSLSVFNSPTATYMWPGLQTASEMGNGPVIYVKYSQTRPGPPESRSHVAHGQPRDATHHSSSVPTVESAPRKPRPDFARDESSSVPINRIIEPFRKFSLSEHTRYPKKEAGNLRDISPEGDRSDTSRTFSTYCGHSHSGSPSFSTHSSSNDEAIPPSLSASSTVLSREEWENYAQQERGSDGSLQYRCTWENDASTQCGYTSKKQLVKRHIETTHLKYKPFICPVCGKAFPQKTSLETHVHGHTGSTPHVCRYNCGISFKDPARRHRHMVEEHGYVPRPSNRKTKKQDSSEKGESM